MAYQLISAFIPLVVFWIVEEFYGLKAALIVGCIVAIIELAYVYIKDKKIPLMVWVGNGMVLVFGAVSFWMQSGVAFKLQPAVMEIIMAMFLIVMRFKTKEVFLIQSLKEMPGMAKEKKDLILSQPILLKRFRALDTRLIIFMFVHGTVLAWIALYGSTRAWILMKGVLFYVLLVLVALPLYIKPKKG